MKTKWKACTCSFSEKKTSSLFFYRFFNVFAIKILVLCKALNICSFTE